MMERDRVKGGMTAYGQIVGILMSDTKIPRIPGDPGYAGTFSFPVRYGVIKDFPFSDLIDGKRDHLENVLSTAVALQEEGVRFIAADCGLFSLFQREIADTLNVPFLGSSLSLIPLIQSFLPSHKKVGVITGDTRILREAHLKAVGVDPRSVKVGGLDDCAEFQRVVVHRGDNLDPSALREGVIEAAAKLFEGTESIGAVVFECTNLITFRIDIQENFKVPVFDLVSLIDFFASGYRLRPFRPNFI